VTVTDWQRSAELDAILARARKRLEGNWLRVEGTVDVTRTSDTGDLHRLVAAFQGSSPRLSLAKKVTVDLAAFDDWLRRDENGGRPLLDRLAPVTNTKLVKAEDEAYREATERTVRELLGDRLDPSWLDWLRSSGNLTRDARTGAVRDAARVLARLPARDISLTELAESATGNTKALTKGPVAALVLKALSLAADEQPPDSPEDARALWERHGVILDTLSSQVLGLGLRVHERHLVGRWLDDCAGAGEPFTLTLDHLIRHPVTVTDGPVFVCENPAVLAAAARRLGPRCPAMICTQGQPSAAARRLLAAIAGQVRWRGDFDWTGLRTTADAIARYGAVPWRMDAETYAVARSRGRSEPFKTKDSPCESPWDPGLAADMRESGFAVMEERIIDELLGDLDAAQRTPDQP
jgi:uncharacterized protein (TIGR02679 family)